MLYNNDCLEIMKTMKDSSIEAIITDPPYDFSEQQKNEFHKEFLRVTKGAIIVFSPPENLWQLKSDQTLFWMKPISTKNTSKSYSRFVEVIQIFGRGKWNCNRHWSNYVNVFNDFVEVKIEHPFQKPMALIKRLIENHTNEQDLVFDPFSGSGTTGIACKNLKRRFIGCEKDKKYFELANKRLEE